jgi:hypothetical protein
MGKRGYDFLRWRGLSGYALLGLTADAFRMDARGPNWDYLGSQAGALDNPDVISREIGMFTIETGFQQFVPFKPASASGSGLIGSLQFGYGQQFALGSWGSSNSSNSNRVAGTSDMNLSGMWISLGVGIGYSECTRAATCAPRWHTAARRRIPQRCEKTGTRFRPEACSGGRHALRRAREVDWWFAPRALRARRGFRVRRLRASSRWRGRKRRRGGFTGSELPSTRRDDGQRRRDRQAVGSALL